MSDGVSEAIPLSGAVATALQAELTMLEMFVRRTHTRGFAQWYVRNKTAAAAIRTAAESVSTKQLALLARCSAQIVYTA